MNARHKWIVYPFKRLSEVEMQKRARSYYELMSLRRSVREFSPEPVPQTIIEFAIRTAGSSPSGANKQPWFFCVVKDPDIKHNIRLAAEKEEEVNYQKRFTDEWLKDLAVFETNEVKEYIDIAPVLIVVFKENYRVVNGQKRKNYYVNESVGIAAGMLISALHNAGLSTLTHTPNPMRFLNKILNRPKNEAPVILMPVGYPKADVKVPDLKRKSLDDIMKCY